MSNAAEDREAHPLLVHDDYATDGVDQVDDCEKPPEQYLQRDEFASSEETEVPLGEREEGQYHVGNYNERLHRLLATIFRVSPSQAIPQGSRRHPSIFIQPVSLARLLQQPIEPYHLRDLEQRLQEAIPRDPILSLQ